MSLRSVTAMQCTHVVAHVASAPSSITVSPTVLLCGSCKYDIYAERAAAAAAHRTMHESPRDYKLGLLDRARARHRSATLKVANYEHGTAMLNEALEAHRKIGSTITKQGGSGGTSKFGQKNGAKGKSVSFTEGAKVVGVSALLATLLVDESKGATPDAGNAAEDDAVNNTTDLEEVAALSALGRQVGEFLSSEDDDEENPSSSAALKTFAWLDLNA